MAENNSSAPLKTAEGAPVAQWQKRHPDEEGGAWQNTNRGDAIWWRDNSQGWEIRALYEVAPQAVAAQAPAAVADEMSPEFTDTARAALMWVLWHHQGSSSEIGTAMRFALGMGKFDRLNDHQLSEAKRWAEIKGVTKAASTEVAAPSKHLALQWCAGALQGIADEKATVRLTGFGETLTIGAILDMADKALATPEIPATEDSSAGDVAHDALRCAVGNCTFNGEVAQHAAGCQQPMQSAQAEVQAEPVADDYPHEQMDALALARYKVVPSDQSMYWRHAIVAGDGQQHLYNGSEVDCQNVARKFAGAFLDGAFAFHSLYTAPQAQPTINPIDRLTLVAAAGLLAGHGYQESSNALQRVLDAAQAGSVIKWQEGVGLLWEVHAFGKPAHRVVSPLNWDAHGVYLALVDAHYSQHIDVKLVSAENNNLHSDADAPPQAQPADALDAETIKKAARYDWLRSGNDYQSDGPMVVLYESEGDRGDRPYWSIASDALDASIDAAMAAAQEGGKASAGMDGAA